MFPFYSVLGLPYALLAVGYSFSTRSMHITAPRISVRTGCPFAFSARYAAGV